MGSLWNEDDVGNSGCHTPPGEVCGGQRGIPLREFVTQAVKDKLAVKSKGAEKPWVRKMGKLKHLHKETERINRLIEEDSEKIDPETQCPEVQVR